MWPGCPSLSARTASAPASATSLAGEHERRVEVALHDGVGSEAAPRVGDAGAPVEADHARPGGVHRFEEMVAADPEMDPGRTGVELGELGEHPPRVREHEPVVVAAGECTRPRVEELERRSPRSGVGAR